VAIGTRSNRVSARCGLYFPETEFLRQRQEAENGLGFSIGASQEPKRPRASPPIRGLLAVNGEISVRRGLRGGAGRTRTRCQAHVAHAVAKGITSRRTGRILETKHISCQSQPIGALFELRDLGVQDLEGVAEGGHAFKVVRRVRWKAGWRRCVGNRRRSAEHVARHCTEAGLTEKAAGSWGKAGQRSVERPALVEAVEQFTRALDQIASAPSTPALRREQIKLQIAVIIPLIHVKGYAALETRTAVERARQLVEKAEALGEHPEDPLLLFPVLYGFWVVNTVAFRGDVTREFAAQFLALAEKQGTTDALMIGHRLMGTSLSQTGNIAEGRRHLDQSVALYDPVAHRALATRFGQDIRIVALAQLSQLA
jgi:hypothetical protein